MCLISNLYFSMFDTSYETCVFVVLLEVNVAAPWFSILLTNGKINGMLNPEQQENQFSRILRFRITFICHTFVFLIMSHLG